MITRLKVKNFKALRDIDIALTPIHVLIGPNDSGKTSILDALAALCRTVDHGLREAFLGSWTGTELVWAGQSHGLVDVAVDFDSMDTSYRITVAFAARHRSAAVQEEVIQQGESQIKFGARPLQTCVRKQTTNPHRREPHQDELLAIARLLGGIHYYRWNPQFLALPVAPDAQRRFRMESNGFGLALCLDEILSYDRDRFIQLENRFRQVFPHIKSIKLQQESAYRAPVDDPALVTMLQKADGKGLYFELVNGGQLVPAAQASDGTLLVLAYLAVLYLPKPPRLLLVEEPENGIHPKRLQDILKILRELIQEQSHTQIILTTHSPYVVDLFEPDEVTLCTKLDNGEVKTTRLSDSPTIRQQLHVFTLGEIWTSEGDENIADRKEQIEEPSE